MFTSDTNLFRTLSVYIFEENACRGQTTLNGRKSRTRKGELVKLRMLLAIALLAFAGLAVPAPAEEGDIIVVVPFEFVAGTQKLPAGKYVVSRTSSLAASPLFISSHDHGVFLLPVAFDDTRFGDASLSFDQTGGQHVLSQIKTPAGIYTVENRREAERLAQVTNDDSRANGMTSSGGQ